MMGKHIKSILFFFSLKLKQIILNKWASAASFTSFNWF